MTTDVRPSVLVIQNDPDGGPRRVGDWLAANGITVDVHHGYDDPVLPERLGHAGLIVLGGGYLPDADDRAPWLAPARNLVRQAIDDAVPFLGICLGGQMLAHVAGGVVTGETGVPENGSTPIRLRETAAADPLFGGLPELVTGIEHHVDAITTLPPDAVWLAESDRCPYQALRVGDCAWGVQFHPEVTPERLLTWSQERLRSQGFDRDTLHRQAVADGPAAARNWRTVIDRFATQVTATADRRRGQISIVD